MNKSTQLKFPLEIINAGMYRGGTSSLSLALEEGFGPTWHITTNAMELQHRGAQWWIENDIFRKLDNNESVDFDEWLQQIQCRTIMDTPVVWYWEKIFAQYPDVKVIVSVRDYKKWSKSYVNLLSHMTSTSMAIAKLTDVWALLLMKGWDVYHSGDDYQNLPQFLALEKNRRDHILKRDYYDGFIENVKRVVPKQQLLIFDPADGWKPLCEFLKVPIPKSPFPSINDTKQLNAFLYQWKKQRFLESAHQIVTRFCGFDSVILLIVLIATFVSIIWFES